LHILITNDDGIFAPGITALAEGLSKIARVSVIAPDQNRSGVSRAITLESPLRIMKTPTGWWQLNGTPADCVKIALSGFLNEEPDMVISGINAGANLGDDVLYSGTVGGAMEGRFLKFPPIAISSTGHGHSPMFYETAAAIACRLVEKFQKSPPQPGVIFNVNVPSCELAEVKGMQITRQGDRHESEPIIASEDGRGRRIYWLGDSGKIKDGSEGTDFHAVTNKYVSITPLHIDLTAHHHLSGVKTWLTE
jgi:5'-nucleotidase